MRAVVLIAQDRLHVTLDERQADGSFAQSDHTDGVIELRSIGSVLPLAEAYEDLPST